MLLLDVFSFVMRIVRFCHHLRRFCDDFDDKVWEYKYFFWYLFAG